MGLDKEAVSLISRETVTASKFFYSNLFDFLFRKYYWPRKVSDPFSFVIVAQS